MAHGNEINSKRFYWLKMDRHFFNDARLKKMRKLPKGDTCVIIYLKLLLLSVEYGGVLVYEHIEDTFEKEMALKLEEKEVPTETTIQYLKQQGMLVPVEGKEDEFFLIQAQNSIGSETKSNVYKRQKRDGKEWLEKFQPSSNQIPIEKEIDIERELDINEERKKERNIKKTSACAPAREYGDDELVSHADIMDQFGITGLYREILENYLRACYLNGHIVLNDVLRDLLSRLDKYYQDDDEAKILAIRKAMNGGYYDIVELRDAPEVWR